MMLWMKNKLIIILKKLSFKKTKKEQYLYRPSKNRDTYDQNIYRKDVRNNVYNIGSNKNKVLFQTIKTNTNNKNYQKPRTPTPLKINNN